MTTTARTLLCIGTLCTLAACTKPVSIQPDEDAARSAQSSSAKVAATNTRRPCTQEDMIPTVMSGGIMVWKQMNATWNMDKATTSVKATMPEFTVSVPYNPLWGNTDCSLPPFETYENQFIFGPASIFEGGGAMRFGKIVQTSPVRSPEEVEESARKRREEEKASYGAPLGTEPVRMTINGNTVVQYGESGFCGQTTFEVFGKGKQYSVYSDCDIIDVRPLLETLTIQ